MNINTISLGLSLFLLSLGCSPVAENNPDSGSVRDSGFVSKKDSTADVVVNPDNCQQYDGDKNACAQSGCNTYYETPIWCVKQGECLIDNQHPGFCDHVPNTTMNAIGRVLFRTDLGIAIESGKETAGLTDWETCSLEETGPAVCLCVQQTGNEAVGECL